MSGGWVGGGVVVTREWRRGLAVAFGVGVETGVLVTGGREVEEDRLVLEGRLTIGANGGRAS